MRFAVTIIFNGLHHLKHRNFSERMLQLFDHWVVVEGAVKNNGSTQWCNTVPDQFHENGSSKDGTVAYLREFSKGRKNMSVITSDGMWLSKDAQFNAGIDVLKAKHSSGWLWQVDADEHWNEQQLIRNEAFLKNSGAKTGASKFHQFVGPGLVATGQWGGNTINRLWKWDGETFAAHEPPTLEGGNGKEVILPEKFLHYSYYFEKDVHFKDAFYRGYKGVLSNWQSLQQENQFPQPISRLLPKGAGRWQAQISRTNLDQIPLLPIRK